MDPNKWDPSRWGTNYRANYEGYYGTTRDPVYQVHHTLPQTWRGILAKANINVDDPRLLREVLIKDKETGTLVHQRLYTDVWNNWAKGFEGRNPTARDIVKFAKQLEEQYAIEGTLFYRVDTNLPSTVDWNMVEQLLQGGL